MTEQYVFQIGAWGDYDYEYIDKVMIGPVNPRTVLQSFKVETENGLVTNPKRYIHTKQNEKISDALIKHFKLHGFKVVSPTTVIIDDE